MIYNSNLIPGYTCDNQGNVYSPLGRLLKVKLRTGHEYLTFTYRKKETGRKVYRQKVHTFVADAVHGPRPVGSIVRHLDGDIFNNHPNNLKYGTRKENAQDRRIHNNGFYHKRGSRFNSIQIQEIRSKYIPYKYTAKMLAEEYGCSVKYMQQILNNEEKWSNEL